MGEIPAKGRRYGIRIFRIDRKCPILGNEPIHVTALLNRDSSPTLLLRESYRRGGRVKSLTSADLAHREPARGKAFGRTLPVP